MHPIIFEIGPFQLGKPLGEVGPFALRSFGLMVVLGFLLGAHWVTRMGVRGATDVSETRKKFDAVPMWVLGGVIGGARLMYVVVEVLRQSPVGEGFLANPLSLFYVWEGGLVMYGGAFGGLLGGWWAARKQGLDVANVFDLGTAASFLGLAVGRIGCLLVGDDYGSVVPESLRWLPFPVTLHVPEELKKGSLFGEANAGQVLWATQTWMSINAACIAALGYRFLRRRRYRGQVALRLLGIYAVMRFLIEMFRGDEIRGVWFGGAVSTSQLISIATGLVCLALLWRNRGRAEEDARLPDSGPPSTPPTEGEAG
jgi:phosphatidylglycerol:prolipoprotein diacylglycerol transferase